MSDDTDVEYEVYAIRYAQESDRKLWENYVWPVPEPRDLHDMHMPLDYFVWMLRGGGRTIIVDTGFDEKEGARRGREILFPVAQSLKALGVDPGTVADVCLTHLHWDHAGNHDLFPNARYHVQDREMRYCTGRCMCHAPLRRGFSVQDVTAMIGKVYDGRVQFHDGVGEIAPGVTVHWVGGHTRGLQLVRVRTRRQWLVLASDASHYYANMERSHLFPSILDVEDMLNAFKTIRSLASSDNHWIPGHDPLVLKRYPAVHQDLSHIVRVDCEPIAS
ncbi:N-acyl homoserine lactonase family protein [Mesorhizobium sp. A556]